MEKPGVRWLKKPGMGGFGIGTLKRSLKEFMASGGLTGGADSDIKSESSGCQSITEGPFEILRPLSAEKVSKTSELAKNMKRRRIAAV